jgi:hypothetical protein
MAGAVTAALMTLTAAHTTTPPCQRLVSSIHNFQQHFRDLGKSDVSTLERVVFSLVLANSKTPHAETGRQ